MKTYSVFYPAHQAETVKVKSSSNLFEIRYEAKIMTVTFTDKSVYAYAGKGIKTVFQKLKRENDKSVLDQNRSVGKLFNRLVINNALLRVKKLS